MTVLDALRRSMGIIERRVRFANLREALKGADQHLLDRVRSLDTIDQGALDRLSGPALRDLAEAQVDAVEVSQDAIWDAIAREVEFMGRVKEASDDQEG